MDSDSRKTYVGLVLIWMTVVAQTSVATLGLIVTCFSLKHLALIGPPFACIYLLIQSLAAIGFGLCLYGPREAGSKGWLVTTGMLNVAFFAAVVSYHIFDGFANLESSRSIAVSAAVRLLEVLSWLCFLLWFQRLLVHLQFVSGSKQTLNLVKFGPILALLYILPMVWLFLGQYSHEEVPMPWDSMLMFGCISVAYFAFVIWLGNLGSLLFDSTGYLSKSLGPDSRSKPVS